MTYIELINNFWELDEDWQFTCCETRLYFYLLKTANRLGWVNSWTRSDAKVSSDVGVSVNSMKTARNRLVQAGLIEFKPGGNGQRDKTRYEVRCQFRCQNLIPKPQPKHEPNLIPNLEPKPQPYINKTKIKTKSFNISPIPPKGDLERDHKLREKEAALGELEEAVRKQELAHELGCSAPSDSSTIEAELEFERFRKEYPGTKRGFRVEFDNFKKRNKDYLKIVYSLYPALLKLMEWRRRRKELNLFVPEYAHLRTWINQRRWEVELEKIEENGNVKYTDRAEERERQTDKDIMEYAAKAFGKDIFGDS